ncbi:MAG TPA: oligosaccharide flippase family protein [Blastocatellia bacterium]|nr:oligosaccharide flippase family protein [Blastocatellia bacterium]
MSLSQSATAPDTTPAAGGEVGRLAGRGTVYITLAKVWFMVSGYALHFVISRLLTKEQYGLYSVVVDIVSIVNAVVITGTYQSVSRLVAQEEHKADSIKLKALRLQLGVGGGIAAAFCLLAPMVAFYLNDARLTNYLRLASLITLAYSFYAVFTGYFNGQKRFLAQAALDATYSTLKLAMIVAFVWLGYGVAGGIGGFALAATTILLISAVAAGRGNRTGPLSYKDLFGFQAYLLAFTLLLNLLQKIDLILIKALSSVDPEIAARNAGEYAAAINVANITYQIIISVTFVVFPLVSQSTFKGEAEITRKYIMTTCRYTLIVMALVATLFSANSGEVIRLIYRSEYTAGAPALTLLAYGMMLFGLIYVLTTIISASGRPSVSLIVGGVTLVTSVALNYQLIPRSGIRGAAMATTLAMLVGAAIAGCYTLAKFRVFVPPLSVVRIAVCAAAVYLGSVLVPVWSRPIVIMKLAVLTLVYVAGLVLSREYTKADGEALRKLLPG